MMWACYCLKTVRTYKAAIYIMKKLKVLQLFLLLLQKIVANPCLIIDGLSRFDFGQGILGETSVFIHKLAHA